jgi:filamentous hemagglutinin family protein
MKRHASMNRIYRLVWNPIHKLWVPVAEISRGRSKGSSRKLFAAALSLTAAVGHTEPIGGQIVSGNGSISQTGDTTTINQTSQNLSANWQSFNIAPAETVNFVQPNTSAIAVNRIADTRGTQILGHLNANGQVYLINPNGILFGQGAQVNVGGLVASTLDVNDASLNSNSRTFSGSGTGSVINKGTINASNGGSVALIGNTVSNQGTITAQLGTVALGAGNAVTLTFNGNSLVHMQVDQSVLNSLAENGGLIQADGGQVIMTAGARDTLLASVVNNTGVIEARTVNNRNGVITLLGGMEAGTTNVGGTLDASAPNGGNGGFIETSAAHVHVADNARVTTLAPSGNSGTWLIDPVDFTIAASGGDMTGAAVSSALAGGNFSIQSTSGASGTSGNINVNDVVSWNVNKLTLNALNNININANMNATGSASLALEFGQGAVALNNTSNIVTGNGAAVNLPASTTNFTTKQGSNGAVKNYTVITSLGAAGSTTTTDLQGMDGNGALNYALGANIDASATSGWNAGAGFAPVGSSGYGLTGVFDGLGHTISNLTINRPGTFDVGLFTFADTGAVIRNVGLVGGSVSGSSYVGGLAGENFSVISNSYATATVSGTSKVGGLVGNNQGTISNSHATGTVSGSGYVGGLVGRGLIGTISNSYATGNVTSSGHYVGGLAGFSGGIINNSYAIGNVTGTGNEVGGLVGLGNGDISNSYATGSVNGGGSGYDIGGLVGNSGGAISNSYATGAVSGGTYAGGLVGDAGGTISNSYAIGNVSGSDYVGGLAGKARNTISNSYATGSVSGNDKIGGLAGNGEYSTISNSYAAGSVNGNSYVGGLMGYNNGSDISNSYAAGNVSGSSYVGGLVGYSSGDISNSYAAGSVSGGSIYVGGLLGEYSSGTLTANFWDTTTSGRAYGLGEYALAGTTDPSVTGLTTAQMHAQASFVPAGTGAGNWDFTPGTGTWVIFEGQSNPLLRSFMTPLTITANNAVKTYDGLAYNGSAGVSYSVTPNMANLTGTLSYTGGINAGTYAITPGGLASAPVQQGYLINYVNGVLTVNPAAPAASAAPVTPVTPITSANTEPTDSGRVPEPVRNVNSLLTANLTSSSGNNQPGTPGQSTFNNDTQGSGQGAGDKSFSSQSGKDSVLNTTMKIGENGPTVNIMDGGVKLPSNQQANPKDSDEI